MAHGAAAGMRGPPRAVVAALTLSAAVHAAVLGWIALERPAAKPAPVRSAARVELRWIAAAVATTPAAVAPAPREPMRPRTAVVAKPPRVVPGHEPPTRTEPRTEPAAEVRFVQVVEAPAPAASAAVPPISGVAFAMPRLAFPAGAGPARWVRPPAADRPGAEHLAAAQQAQAAQASACARQAALQLHCADAPDGADTQAR